MDIAHRRLANLRLVADPLTDPAEVVRWLGAAQAQDFTGSLWSLGLRMTTATERVLVAAYDAGAIVRTHVLRPTWHFVHPIDVRWMLALTASRVHGVSRTQYRRFDLDAAKLGRCQTIMANALEGGRHLTREELGVALARKGVVDPQGLKLAVIVIAAELDGVLISGPRRGKHFTYALLEERVPAAPRLSRDEALVELTRRYFTSRGPATVHDFARWSGLTVSDARVGLEAVRPTLISETHEGQTFWGPPSEATPARSGTFVFSVFDEYIAGYKDRSAICAEGHWERVVEAGNGLVFVIVLEGQVVGTWRRDLRAKTVEVTFHPFRRFTPAEKRAVLAALDRYGAFVGLSPQATWGA